MRTTRRDPHHLVESLTDTDIDTAARVLEALVRTHEHVDRVTPERVHATPEDNDSDQPVPERPAITFADQLRGDFWPDDEEPDEVELAVRTWREIVPAWSASESLSP